jgi:hypothetical protein
MHRHRTILPAGKPEHVVAATFDRPRPDERAAARTWLWVCRDDIRYLQPDDRLHEVAVATTAADLTGVTAALLIAGLGLFILPRRRRKAREEFREKTEALRERLGEVVERQFETEIDRSVGRMREAIAPYSRFVRTEHARMTRARSALAEITAEVESLRAETGAPGVDSS